MIHPIASAQEITAWLLSSDWQKGLSSLRAARYVLTEISPSWYILNTRGGLNETPNAIIGDHTLMDIVHQSHIILRPRVTNVAGEGTNTSALLDIIRNPSRQKKHATVILDLVTHNKWDGIDLDYEGVKGADLHYLADFVKILADMLHAEGKTLGVDIEKSTDDQVLGAWRRIASSADSVRFMAYPEHTEQTKPGPILSITWSRTMLTRALSVIPAEKLSYAMPLYGRYWSKEGNGSMTWDAFPKENLERDQDHIAHSVGDRTIWFEDAESIRAKIKMAKELGITNFSFWRLGGEDPEVWKLFPRK